MGFVWYIGFKKFIRRAAFNMFTGSESRGAQGVCGSCAPCKKATCLVLSPIFGALCSFTSMVQGASNSNTLHPNPHYHDEASAKGALPLMSFCILRKDFRRALRMLRASLQGLYRVPVYKSLVQGASLADFAASALYDLPTPNREPKSNTLKRTPCEPPSTH